MKTTLKALPGALLIAAMALFSVPASAQVAFPTTTTASAKTRGSNIIQLTSSVGVVAPNNVTGDRTVLFIDRTAFLVQSIIGNAVTVTGGFRGTNARVVVRSGAKVWIGKDTDQYFVNTPPQGACTRADSPVLPVIEVSTGRAWDCPTASGQWGSVSEFYVPPTQCTFAPTTLTTTNTFPQIGASNVFVVNATSNAAAGTNTMTCNILLPTSLSGQGIQILDITTLAGSQTTAPTSLGTATLGGITFPAAATSETASTVTPVALGGTVTTVSPTALTTVTTAGAFLSIKSTFSAVVKLDTDLQLLQYTLPFVQSAASAMTINSPGLIVHYIDSPNTVLN